MEILRSIKLYCDSVGLPFVVIGGHAVNSYGIARHTGDIDLLVKGSQKDQWHILFIEKLRYTATQDDSRFSRFKPSEIAAWPVDLMYVDDSTFSKMIADCRKVEFGQVVVEVVSAKHLVILKIHALKYFQAHRYSKDYSDVISLLRSNAAIFSDRELEEVCTKYASHELFQKIIGEIKT